MVVFDLAAAVKCAAAAVALVLSSCAAATQGRVVGVADGDTLTVLTAENVQVKVRLAEIDAPEKKQAFGQASKQSLSDLCFDRPAEIKPVTTDRYGRTVARVYCSGVDVNVEQVRRGMAWVYGKYVTDRSLHRVQDSARSRLLGLWRDEAPLAPWEWRAKHRPRH